MHFIDTHAHSYARQFAHDLEEMILRFKAAGVKKVFLPNIDQDSIEPMMSLCAAYPDLFIPMMGLHPCHVEENYGEVLLSMEERLFEGGYCAVGEIGLDAFWDKTTLSRQEVAFRKQIQWANELDLPIVIHSRDTLDECIQIVAEEAKSGLRGIFHCFTGTAEQAVRITGLGFKLGIGGVYTFKNSNLNTALAEIALADIVLETDSPYLAPVPYRGKRNESSYIPLVAAQLASDRGIAIEEVARVTTDAAGQVFGAQYLLS
jgi:TatD DNase family protein